MSTFLPAHCWFCLTFCCLLSLPNPRQLPFTLTLPHVQLFTVFFSWWLSSCQTPRRAPKMSPTCICTVPYSPPGVLTSCLFSGLLVGAECVSSHPEEEWLDCLTNSHPSKGSMGEAHSVGYTPYDFSVLNSTIINGNCNGHIKNATGRTPF